MRKRYSKRLQLERLETRNLLAGDVAVQVTDDLVITGDDLGNNVLVEGTGVSGQYLITADDTRILVNGQEQTQPFLVSGVTDDIIVDLNGGDDTLQMRNINAISDIVITMDEGTDNVEMGAYEEYAMGFAAITDMSPSMGVNGALSIDTGTGDDSVLLVRVFGEGNWSITTGDDGTGDTSGGADDVFVFIASADSVTVVTGDGNDVININYLDAQVLTIDAVSGNDVVSVAGSVFREDVNLFGGSGTDTVAMDFCDLRDATVLTLDSGSGDDFILFARSLVDNEADIFAGSGLDQVVIGRYYANANGDLATGGNDAAIIRVDTGADRDIADIRGNAVDQLYGIFGSGNDDVTFGSNAVSDYLLLDGGTNFDRLLAFGNSVSRFDIVNFEQRSAAL